MIRKAVDKKRAGAGDRVQFTIEVTNPSQEEDLETWYQLWVTDDIRPALRIDNVAVAPVAGEVAVNGNTLDVRVDSLAPEASFVITIDCTLVGPVEAGQIIQNTATLVYEDGGGNPQPAVEVEEPPKILVMSRAFCPVVLR
jgi:fimbrial isopeptide formation D2 family protein